MNPSPSKEENSILLEISSPRNKSFVIDSIYSYNLIQITNKVSSINNGNLNVQNNNVAPNSRGYTKKCHSIILTSTYLT